MLSPLPLVRQRRRNRLMLHRTGNEQRQKKLKKLFELKAEGDEEAYIAELQQAGELRKFLERIVKENVG